MTDRRRRFIAWWQIVCGVLGLALFGAMFMDWLPGTSWLTVGFGASIAGQEHPRITLSH